MGVYMGIEGLPGDLPGPLKLIRFNLFDFFWVWRTLIYILTSILSHSDFGNRLGARDMTIVGCRFGSHIFQHWIYGDI